MKETEKLPVSMLNRTRRFLLKKNMNEANISIIKHLLHVSACIPCRITDLLQACILQSGNFSTNRRYTVAHKRVKNSYTVVFSKTNSTLVRANVRVFD